MKIFKKKTEETAKAGVRKSSKELNKKDKKGSRHGEVVETRMRVGNQIDFASSEAYKLLRTNLTFSLNNEDTGNVLGVTSSLSGEGKSLTSINLAMSFAEMGTRVLLIEGDMRKPVLEKYFNVRTPKGLSNLLARQCKLEEAVFRSSKHNNLFYISAGSIPPNPAELLSSKHMKNLILRMREQFDYIILDLPPVIAVADATIVSKYIDGMIIVVRDNYVEKADLAEAVRLLEIAEAKVLGLVYNGQEAGKGHYYKKGYKYYKGYSAYK